MIIFYIIKLAGNQQHICTVDILVKGKGIFSKNNSFCTLVLNLNPEINTFFFFLDVEKQLYQPSISYPIIRSTFELTRKSISFFCLRQNAFYRYKSCVTCVSKFACSLCFDFTTSNPFRKGFWCKLRFWMHRSDAFPFSGI